MPSYRAPLQDFRFVINDVLQIDKYRNLPAFGEASAETVDAILEEGARIAEEVLFPLNRSGDDEGCHFKDGEVTTPAGFKEAYRTFCEGGWVGLHGDPEYGGAGLPQVVATAVTEMMNAANMAFEMYGGLTAGAALAIQAHGSEEQKATYLPKMTSGEWGGTMNLTEPHCGTDLGLLRTRADPADDGSYRISGTKIFISAGEHDLTDNIIHLVLARLPDAPAGTAGISLFIVPKFLIDADGGIGARNGVACGSIEHKMGIRASATCVMNYDGAVGYLLGEPNRGMRAMFTMMNAARLGVALQGLAIGDVAYQNAATYARERLQGRSVAGAKAPDKPADPIIVHPDIRRMLMTQRAFAEGARALGLWTGLHLDLSRHHPDERVRRDSDDLVSLVTPVIKAYFTDMGFESANLGVQVFGGAGFIRETGVEQYVRDARITQIYEGANGIQALDLVGRKLGAHYGRALRQVFHPVDRFIADHAEDDDLGEMVGLLAKSFGRLQTATGWLGEQGLRDPEQAAAASSDYLRLFALVAMAYMWALMAKAARDSLKRGTGDLAFYKAKIATARFFFLRMLPETSSLLSRILSGKEPLMALDADAF
jgi:alkylation response protein AidB-like acyl-CoA dehydrogenase